MQTAQKMEKERHSRYEKTGKRNFKRIKPNNILTFLRMLECCAKKYI